MFVTRSYVSVVAFNNHWLSSDKITIITFNVFIFSRFNLYISCACFRVYVISYNPHKMLILDLNIVSTMFV